MPIQQLVSPHDPHITFAFPHDPQELHGKLLGRFITPGALSSLRPAFINNYLTLTSVCAELAMPPPRAFAGAVRQLVSENVSELSAADVAAGIAAVAQLDGTVAPGVLEKAAKVLVALIGGEAGEGEEAEAVEAGGEQEGEGEAREAVKLRPLTGWRALVAAGQVAPLNADVARQLLAAASARAREVRDRRKQAAERQGGRGQGARERPLGALADVGGTALPAAAAGVLACAGAGLHRELDHALLDPLEEASGAAQGEVLRAMGPGQLLQLAKAFVVAGYQPQVRSWGSEGGGEGGG